jgi:SAM-dependent methyltransferase
MKKLIKYKSYQEYIEHQLKKTNDPKRRAKWNTRFNSQVKAFTDIFKPYNFKPTSKILCVAARLGAEVEAAKGLGLDAIGIDISPCLEHGVTTGDMHNMDFDNDQFDIVFTNSWDHSLYPQKFICEVGRVLMNDGLFLLQIFVNQDSEYEVIHVEEQETIEFVKKNGFELVSRSLTPHTLYKKQENEICLLFRNQKCPSL